MNDETIFAVALEKADPAARAAYLAAACTDADQRRRIEGLLRAVEHAGDFLEKPAVPPPGPGQTDTRAERTPDSGPDDGAEDAADALAFLAPAQRPESLGRIGHYEVLEVLGRGAFGVVYRAFDDVLQRVVAVKVLSPAMAATSPARKRFIREARSAALVQHEHVVRVHAVEEQPLPYLVMEYISGETLQARIDRAGPLEAPEVVRIGRQIAEGLTAAHEKGLVHRDIKPSNVLIERGSQSVKITDFGLARAADDASLTRSGVVAGTPMYMAPEQARGKALDHRADLFSLGSVLYALLTGHPPFRAETTFAILRRVVESAPRPIPDVIPEVPGWLCRIVAKLHAKDPGERYQSAREVAEVLADCEKQLRVHDELQNLSRIPRTKPTPARIDRPRLKWVAAALAAFLLLGGLWFGRPAALYATERGELELLPSEGVTSVIVLQNDEGVIDGNKRAPAITDWLDMTSSHSLILPPGKYQLNAGARGAILHWEVTSSTPLGGRTLRVPGEGHVGWSVIVKVERGKRVTVRPVVAERPLARATTRTATVGSE